MNEEEIHGYSKSKGSTVVGVIPSIVNNGSDMTKVMNGMKRIESMIIAITAEWCGACQRIKKQLHTALNTNRSGIVATNIDLDALNKNPIVAPPSAVPSIGLYVKGKLVKEMNVDELAAILDTPKKNVKNNSKSSKQSLVSANEIVSVSEPSVPELSVPELSVSEPSVPESDMNSASMSTAMNPVSASPILPPSAANDQQVVSTNVSANASANQRGGNLYGALASTAYQLAPPAILLGIANATLGTRKRRSKKTKRSRKRAF